MFKISGKIIQILPETSGTSQRGTQWRSQTYVLEETSEKYPRKIAFDVKNDNIDKFTIKVGDTLEVTIELDAREYNGRWYNSITAIDVRRSLF